MSETITKEPGTEEIKVIIPIFDTKNPAKGAEFRFKIIIDEKPYILDDIFLSNVKKFLNPAYSLKCILTKVNEMNAMLKLGKKPEIIPDEKDIITRLKTEIDAIKGLYPDVDKSEYKPTCIIKDGCIGIMKSKKETNDGESITTEYFYAITNFTFEYLKEVSSEDKIEYETNIVIGDKKFKFNVDAKTLSKNELFEIAIKTACPIVGFKHHDITSIREAFNDFKLNCGTIKNIKKVSMGWHNEEYVMKSVIITKDGIKKNDKYLIDIPTTSKANYIDMFEITNEQFIECGKHINRDFMNLHDRYFIQMAIADAYGAPIQRRLEETNVDEIKYPKIDRGQPQEGKSYVERLIQSFFGIIPDGSDKCGYTTWGSTTYSIESEGGNYCDVIFLADDLSKDILNNEYEKAKFHRLLHNYVSGDARQRLKQNGEQNPTKPIRGLLVVTAENTVTEGQSNTGRVCYVDVPSPEKVEIKEQRRIYGGLCQAMKHLYPGFMAMYITDTIKKENWINDYKAAFIVIRDEFLQSQGDDRSVKMHAIRYVHFEMFCAFMVKNGFMTEAEKADNLSFLKQRMLERIKETSSSIKNESHCAVLVDKLQQLIASGTIPRAQRHDEIDDAHSKNPVGVILDDMEYPDLAFIIPDIAIGYLKRHMREVSKTFEVNQDDIGKELKAQCYIKKSDEGRNAYRIRFNGARPNTWCVSRASIGIPDATTQSQVSLFEIAQVSLNAFQGYGITEAPPTPKQYNLVLFNLINQFRPGLTKTDKLRVWKELDPLIRLVLTGKGWIITQTAKPEEKDIKEAETQILTEIKQPLKCPEIDKLNNLSVKLTDL